MSKVLILEGPDKSAKSTVGRLLSQKLEIPYFKFFRDKEALSGSEMTAQMLKYCDPYFIDFLKQTKHSVIIDRHYVSEWCYSQAFGRKTDEEGIRKTDELFSQISTTILILKRKSYEGVQDDDSRLNPEKLKQLSQKYDEFSKWTKCRTLTFEFDFFDPERMIQEIVGRL